MKDNTVNKEKGTKWVIEQMFNDHKNIWNEKNISWKINIELLRISKLYLTAMQSLK